MRWSRTAAHCVVQVRVAHLNQAFDELARQQIPMIGQRRVSWPRAAWVPGFLAASAYTCFWPTPPSIPGQRPGYEITLIHRRGSTNRSKRQGSGFHPEKNRC
jgi:hypothetical protein